MNDPDVAVLAHGDFDFAIAALDRQNLSIHGPVQRVQSVVMPSTKR